jgi:flagellar biosynthesis protein FlhB
MNSNFSRNLRKIISVINNLHEVSQKILKIGITFFLIVFISGSILLIYNKINFFNENLNYTSLSMIKSSFTVLGEILLGTLIVDFVLKRFEDED